MIRYIKGTYTMQFENGIVVEAGSGVGFEIFVHQGSPIYKHSEGDEIQVFTEMIVREDGMSLYGFHNRETLEFFKMLTTVSGIGPKGAMGILGSMPLSELKLAIAMGDVKSISKAQGVGKKTAERLVVELKDKVEQQDVNAPAGAAPGIPAGSAQREAQAALQALGYTSAEAARAVNLVRDQAETVDQIVMLALRQMGSL